MESANQTETSVCRSFYRFWKITLPACMHTVESRYLELGYSNSSELEASIEIKNTFWLLSPIIILRLGLFYKSKLPEVQINLHFGYFELVKNSPIVFEISIFDCIFRVMQMVKFNISNRISEEASNQEPYVGLLLLALHYRYFQWKYVAYKSFCNISGEFVFKQIQTITSLAGKGLIYPRH